MLSGCLSGVGQKVADNLVEIGTGLTTWAATDCILKGGDADYSSSAMALSGLLLANTGHFLEKRKAHQEKLPTTVSNAIQSVLQELYAGRQADVEQLTARLRNEAPGALAEALRHGRGIGVMGFLMHIGSEAWPTFAKNQLLMGGIISSSKLANRAPLPAALRDVHIPYDKLRYLVNASANWLMLSETKKCLNNEDMSPLDWTAFAAGIALTLTEFLASCKVDNALLAAHPEQKPAFDRFQENKNINVAILMSMLLMVQDVVNHHLDPYTIAGNAYLLLISVFFLIAQISLIQATKAMRAREVVPARLDQVLVIDDNEAQNQRYVRMENEGERQAVNNDNQAPRPAGGL